MQYGNIEIVRLLGSQTADVNAKISGNRALLHLATWGRHVEVMRLLVIKLRMDLNAKTHFAA